MQYRKMASMGVARPRKAVGAKKKKREMLKMGLQPLGD
jgi:hypothetical protein